MGDGFQKLDSKFFTSKVGCILSQFLSKIDFNALRRENPSLIHFSLEFAELRAE